MKMQISVVIIARNESANIVECIESARMVTGDIVVVDSGSVDDTVPCALASGARTVQVSWNGFGHSRNSGAAMAAHDWILALDADERITPELAESIRNLSNCCPGDIFGFRRQSYLYDKKICFGDWGRDKVYRIYHRDATRWNLLPVHESLVSPRNNRKMLAGCLQHFKKPEPYKEQLIRYARLCAKKYYLLGRKGGFAKMLVSPIFSFVNGYIFKLGFLDGREGFEIARSIANYTWLKYYYLQQLSKPVNFSFSEKEYSNLQ